MQDKSIQTRLEKTLERYVAMPTVPVDIEACTAAIAGLAAEFKKLGMAVHTDGPVHPWLIAAPTADALRRKKVKVLLVAHFDVVPLADDTHTFSMQTTKEKLFGRGVYDMKFAAACYKELVQELASQHALNDYDFGILITTDEEKGGYDGARHFLREGWRCDIAVIPDGGWNWSIEERAKSITYMYVRANGRSAHSSRPWLGDNPIYKIAPVITKIADHFKNDDPDQVTVSINSITTSNGKVTNTTQIANWAAAGLTIRAFTEAEALEARKFIESTAKQHGVETEVALDEPPVHLMRDEPLVKDFIATAEQIHGEPIAFSEAMAGSDARHFAKYHIPTVLMYPNGGDHHGPAEWILRSDLYKYFMLCKTYVTDVAKIDGKQGGTSKPSRLRKLLAPLNRR